MDPATGHGFATSGGDGTVVVFDTKTLAVLQRTKVDDDADAIMVDPATGRVFSFNGDARTASVLDAKSGARIGTIELGAKPEFGVADGKGKVYVNLEDAAEIAEIDAAAMKVARRWKIAPCEDPTGLAIDTAHRVLFSVCRNQMMTMSAIDSGKVVAHVAIGPGADGARYDAGTELAFASTGGDGAITVVHEDSPTAYRVVQTVKTAPGARTMELDANSHRLYTVTADFKPAQRGQRPEIVPGTFELIELAQVARRAQRQTRITPSCAVDATSRPSRVKNLPSARPRPPDAFGLSMTYSSQSSTRNGRWNHIAWSRLAICTLPSAKWMPCGSVAVATS
jgi:DNA-binding beta-propeller fold protein YncE